MPSITEQGEHPDTKSPTSPGLDRPEAVDRSNVSLLIYDGHCRICTASMQTLRRWDWFNRLAFLSLHDPRVRELCPDLSHEDLMREIVLLASDGQRYGGVAALRVAARKVPILWPIVPFLYIPGSLPLWAAAYRVLARWRYKFGRRDACQDGTCAVHFGDATNRGKSPRG